jgi:HNH endonuclease
MTSSDPDAVYAVLRAADPDVMDRDELAEMAKRIAQHASWLDSVKVRVTRRQRALADEGRAEAPRDLLAREGGQSGRDARTADDREKVCTALPSFEEALASGDVTSGHVDALAAAVRDLDQVTAAEFFSNSDSLLDKAQAQGVDAFGQTCRDLARAVAAEHAAGSEVAELERQRDASKIKRWTDKATGMRQTLISLDPERDKIFWTAVSHALRKLRQQPAQAKTWHQLEVEALMTACSSGGGGPERVPSLIVLCDVETLRAGVHAKTVCETEDGTPLPIEVVRRLACEADVIPVVLNGRGEALAVGRAQRLATPAQRVALRAMHRTCIGATCTVAFEDCQIHHVIPWEQGGATDLSNLAPLCSRDHYLVHEGGWRLTMTADRIATWTRSDGTVFHNGTTVDRAPSGVASPDRHLQLI